MVVLLAFIKHPELLRYITGFKVSSDIIYILIFDSAMEEQFQLYVFDEEDGMFEEESAGGLQEPLGQEASMTVIDLSQSSGSDQEVNMRPCQERTHTKERGVRKCAVHSCRETFSGATPMLYNIRRDHAGGAQNPEEFVSFLADISAEVFQTHQREPVLQSLKRLRAWAERQLGRVD